MTGKGIQKLRVVDAAPEPDSTATAAAALAIDTTQIPAIAEEVNQLLNALAGYGVDLRDTVVPSQIRPRIESFSACRILVLKGICTEEEMQAVQLEAHRDLLRGILQAAEHQRLQQQQEMRKVIAPESPKGLLIAKH